MKTINLYELRKVQTTFPKEKIKSSLASANFIKQFYNDDIEIFESCFILMLNRQNQTIGYAKISQGGIAGTVVDVRLICKYAVDTLCSSIVLSHNHPSGNLTPSADDFKITEKVKNALNLLEINLLDHIILTAEGHYSFADEDKL